MGDIRTYDINWDDIRARFVPPLELQQSLPRRVVRRQNEETTLRARIERGCLGGCLVPLLVLGILLLFWSGLAALILPLGATTLGTITERERGNGRENTYFLRFRFRIKGRNYEGESQAPTEKWRRAKTGDAIKVRYFPFAPGLRPLLADDFSAWASILGLGALGLLITGVSGLPLLGLLTRPQDRKLARNGLAVPALIGGQDDHGRIIFLICDQDGRTIELKEPFASSMIYRVGIIETALHHPNKPHSARLYSDLDWRGKRD